MLTLATMVSCSSEDVLNNADNDNVEIKLNAGVVSTKAPIDSNDEGIPTAKVDNVQFLRLDGETPAWETLSTASFTGAVETTGNITVAEGQTQYYPTNGGNANILGFYPKADRITSGKASFTIDGSQDILYAGAVSGSKTAAIGSLVFTHKLTQFKFVVKRDNSINDVSNVSVTIQNANSKFDLNLADGVLSAWGTSVSTIKPVTAATATEAGSAASEGIMLEPGLSSITLSVSGEGFNAQTVTINGTEEGEFKAGKAYTLTLTFKAKEVAGQATLAKWQEGTAGEAEIN